jgi:hypothetical protein
MVHIQVTRSPTGDLLVGVPAGYQPLNLLLQLDLQTDPDFLDSLIRVAADPEVERYEVGGDVCWISVVGSQVTVDTDDGARAVTLDREEFREALVRFQELLAAPPPVPSRTRQPWRPPDPG